jgi:formylglycine-generating enzyme required for sulfatase activity
MGSRGFWTLPAALLALSAIVFFSSLATAQGKDNAYTNSIGMKFVLVPAGTFMMGGDENIEVDECGELPRHQVTISQAFYLSSNEVTQRQWEDVLGDNPSYYEGEVNPVGMVRWEDNPVEMVSWEDVQVFIVRLNQKEGQSRYRLPTEAEWEYAARAGSTGAYYFGDDESQLENYAWYGYNSYDTTHPVGQKLPNAWGLYDMLGNVWEWTGDWYEERYYANSPSADPTGPSSGAYRVTRGCGWFRDAKRCRSAYRDWREPGSHDDSVGFRLALSPEGGE